MELRHTHTHTLKWIETLSFTISITHRHTHQTDGLIKFYLFIVLSWLCWLKLCLFARAADESWEPVTLWCYHPHITLQCYSIRTECVSLCVWCLSGRQRRICIWQRGQERECTREWVCSWEKQNVKRMDGLLDEQITELFIIRFYKKGKQIISYSLLFLELFWIWPTFWPGEKARISV